MPTIRIDDEVWKELKKRAVPLEDTPNSVLRRILKLRDDKPERKARKANSPSASPKVTGGTPRHQFREPILRVLVDAGGSGQEGAVLKKVEELMAGQLTKADKAPVPEGREKDIHWKLAAREEHRIMAKKGLVKPECPRGIWELTEEGLKAAERMGDRGS
ncbi:MAG: hypothetical protein JSU61_01285 [Fidelibacterota bacterium]|nr:MAG: hypothetical protein JSU61_01285 [Candidatus Neomarinimicrobiota bacterium]